jgi:hypothetical protein
MHTRDNAQLRTYEVRTKHKYYSLYSAVIILVQFFFPIKQCCFANQYQQYSSRFLCITVLLARELVIKDLILYNMVGEYPFCGPITKQQPILANLFVHQR